MSNKNITRTMMIISITGMIAMITIMPALRDDTFSVSGVIQFTPSELLHAVKEGM